MELGFKRKLVAYKHTHLRSRAAHKAYTEFIKSIHLRGGVNVFVLEHCDDLFWRELFSRGYALVCSRGRGKNSKFCVVYLYCNANFGYNKLF